MSLNLLRLASFRERKCNSQFYCDWGSFMPELGFFADAHITTISFLECLIVQMASPSFKCPQSYILFQNYTVDGGREGRWERTDMWLYNYPVQDFSTY